MGLTKEGYVRRTYDDILSSKISTAKELFGEDIDTGDQTPLGKFIRINAYSEALIEEEIEAVYYARFPNSASGTSLDRLLVFGNLKRNPAEAACYSVLVEGRAGHTIPAGFLVGTDTELTFYTAEQVTIGDDGACEVKVACTEAGTVGNVNAGAITKIINPDINVSAVSGISCLEVGKDEESDADLRVRLKSAIAGSGSCNVNAIRAAILRVPTVKYAEVIENDTNEADSEGRPAHSFQCYVLGGEGYEKEIGEAIFSKRAVGVQAIGDKSVTITDASGKEKVVKYSPALNVNVNIRIQIKTSNLFASDGAQKVQNNVAEYINGLGIGKTLVLSSIYGHIYKVTGVSEVTTLEVSTNGGSSYNTSNVAVPQYGIAVCAGVSVEVVT